MGISAQELIRIHQLLPHPEGGYFRETYRSAGVISRSSLPSRYKGDRCYSTAIYYLLPQGAMSRLHRLASDEMWHFYVGGAMRVVEIREDGAVENTAVGSDVNRGERLQHVVKAGTWFGAYPELGSEFSFVGCTVAPGFDFADFHLAEREQLIAQFPHAKEVIERLTLP